MERELSLASVGGKQLWGKVRGDPASSRAVVVLVHGLGEHIQRYEHVAEAFARRGFALLGFDQQGHGKTHGKRGVIAANNSLLRDIEAMVILAKQLAPEKPVYLYGHSLGGVEVLYYGLNGREKVDGIMATSPGIDPNIMSKMQRVLVRLLKPILPRLTIDNGLDANALSRDDEVVARYQRDALVHPKISLELAAFMLDGGDDVRSRADEWQVPLYLAHGSADTICPVEGSRAFASMLAEKVVYQEWEGLFHETHNELEQEQVLATMLDWLDGQLSG